MQEGIYMRRMIVSRSIRLVGGRARMTVSRSIRLVGWRVHRLAAMQRPALAGQLVSGRPL